MVSAPYLHTNRVVKGTSSVLVLNEGCRYLRQLMGAAQRCSYGLREVVPDAKLVQATLQHGFLIAKASRARSSELTLLRGMRYKGGISRGISISLAAERPTLAIVAHEPLRLSARI